MRSPRRTPEEWQSIIDRFKGSGLTQAEFCEKKEIKICTLRYWLYRPIKTDPQFVPLMVHESSPVVGNTSWAPITLRVEGVFIEIDIKDCVRILRAAAR